MGEPEEAEYYRSKALSFLHREENIRPHWFQQLIDFYRKQGKQEKALDVLRQAVEAVPDYAHFHIQLGDYYRREGITYRAEEEYKRALMLEPGNGAAGKRLRQMGLKDAY
jgi:tetratricopeptide (TPR) repeat protein